jgi:hypothetical protein
MIPKAFPDHTRLGVYFSLALLAPWMVVRQLTVARRLRALPVDDGYKQRVTQARWILNVGMILLIASILFSTISSLN